MVAKKIYLTCFNKNKKWDKKEDKKIHVFNVHRYKLSVEDSKFLD